MIFILGQDQKKFLIEFMHYPKQDKHEFNQDTFLIMSQNKLTSRSGAVERQLEAKRQIKVDE